MKKRQSVHAHSKAVKAAHDVLNGKVPDCSMSLTLSYVYPMDHTGICRKPLISMHLGSVAKGKKKGTQTPDLTTDEARELFEKFVNLYEIQKIHEA